MNRVIPHNCCGLCLLLVIFILTGGCAGSRSSIPDTSLSSSGMVDDLYHFPQNLHAYVQPEKAGQPLVSHEQQSRMNARFDKLYFGPWHASRASVRANDAFAVFGGQQGASTPRGWAENLLPWSRQAWDRLVANADRSTFPSRLERGITVQQTVLREAPTFSPRFGNPQKAGEGFPFDMFMYSSLPVGMPVLIIHASADGAWCYVETALVSGWVPASDIAVTDAGFRERFENGKYAAFIKENISLHDESGRFVCMAGIGTVLPFASMGDDSAILLAPVKDAQGKAVLLRVSVPASVIARKPLPLTEAALAQTGNEMMGQPYGWGGAFGDRDCSLMLRDLFVPFGIWLPRNSSAQARSWDFQNFSELSPKDKEQMILQNGKPFATLLWLPGHIALYLGEYEGRAAMLHTLWGIRTREGKREGRHIIGRTVVTSLTLGKELPHVQDKNGLVARMKGMSILH